MKKAYIAGKVTGLPKQVYTKLFNEKELELRNSNRYHWVYNPVTIIEIENDEWDYNKIMRRCICDLMASDEIHLLSNWEDSKGARMEVAIAKMVGITVVYPEGYKKKGIKFMEGKVSW